MAWPSHQRVGRQEGNASLRPPIAATFSGAQALGALMWCISPGISPDTSSCHVLWFVRDMIHYPSSLLCCLCPVIVLSRRAVTHRSPPAHGMVELRFLQGLGHHRVQSVPPSHSLVRWAHCCSMWCVAVAKQWCQDEENGPTLRLSKKSHCLFAAYPNEVWY